MNTKLASSVFLWFLIFRKTCSISSTNFYPYGHTSGDSLVPSSDDGSSPPIYLSILFPYFNHGHNLLFVNTNGVITFQTSLSAYTPDSFPYNQSIKIIAPYWGDINTLKGGDIWYRESHDPALLQRASTEVRTGFPQFPLFQASWIFISTWSDVAFYGADDIGLKKRCTFQCVLVTDGIHSFVMFFYNKIQWTTGTASHGNATTGLGGTPAQVGFDAGDGSNYYAVPVSRTPGIINIGSMSNVGIPGMFIFRVDLPTIERSAAANSCGGESCLNGTCISTDGLSSWKCECVPGFTGRHCDTEIDECESNPCFHNSTCIDLFSGWRCACLSGYTGDACQIEINECESNPCFHNATCTDLVSGWRCTCLPGYTGDSCQIEIDECESNPCFHNATCIDLFSGWQCTCLPGYSGDACQIDIAECASSPCQNNGYCLDLINYYMCHCRHGYKGDNCETDIDECRGNPCLHGSTCQDLENDFLCQCQPGYIGDTCQIDVNECESNPCYNNATCVDVIAAWKCVCLSGYTGTDCSIDVDECQSDPCKHDSTCIDLVNNYMCICTNESSGQQCEQWMDHCSFNPCLHGGSCINHYGGFTCDCIDTWFGEICEYEQINKSETCTDLEYTECSCSIQKLKPKPKPNNFIGASVGFGIGLVSTIAAYSVWMIITYCNDKRNNGIKVTPDLIEQRNFLEDSFISKNTIDTTKSANVRHSRGNKSTRQKGYHDCFTDHTGFDFAKLYRDKNGNPLIPKCRHCKSTDKDKRNQLVS